MKRVMILSGVILFLCALAVSTRYVNEAQAAAPAPLMAAAAKTGWWVKIRTDKTEATSIDFQIGTKREDRETWVSWRSSDAVEFDVPEKYLQVARIYVGATANPQGKKAWFCLMYKDHGVKHYDFDNRQEEDRSQTDRDGDCD